MFYKDKDFATFRSLGNCLFSPRGAQDRKERVVDNDPAVERGVEGFVRVQGDQVLLLFFIFFFNFFSTRFYGLTQVLHMTAGGKGSGSGARYKDRT